MTMREFADMPGSIASLPREERGYPIPWFVAFVDGKPDFRVMDERKLRRVLRGDNACWVCGQAMGARKTHVIGPMCVVNRVAGEPPSHWACAVFSARYCPFLSLPHAQRREHGLPENATMPGIGIKRNPGVVALWEFRGAVQTFGDGRGGTLFRLPSPPERIGWYREGREATRAEVDESINTGCPILRGMAEKEGPSAVAHFEQMLADAQQFLPASTP